MLSDIQQQAIMRCLNGIDRHAKHFPWPGPVLFAALREEPAPGHPDPTARLVRTFPLPVPPARWHLNHPAGPVAALRQITERLHQPSIQATFLLSTQPSAKVRTLAWVFMHPIVVDDADLGRVQVRVIDAVDIDGRTYVLTRRPNTPQGLITVDEQPSDDEAIKLLGRLATLTRPAAS